MNLKNYLVLFLFLLLSSTLLAQLRRPSLKALSEMKKRTLIVNVDDFEGIEKELVEVMDSIWVFNDRVEYKTADEINRLKDRRKKNYAVLSMRKEIIQKEVENRPGTARPNRPSQYDTKRAIFLSLDLIEHFRKLNHGYLMPLPIFKRDHDNTSAIIGIRILQNHITKVLKKNRRQHLSSFAKEEAKSKCETLTEMEFLLSNAMTSEEVRQAVREQNKYNIKVVTNQEVLEEAIFKGRDVLVSVAIPSEYTKPQTILNEITTHYFRAFVHAETGEFYVKFDSTLENLTAFVTNHKLELIPHEINKIGKKCK